MMLRGLLLVALCSVSPALATLNVSPDMSGYATKADIDNAMQAATTNSSTKLDAVPTTGPGPGKCRFSVVPSNLIQSGGVTGTAGTCSRIVQCGTSGAYVVAQFNIGDGC